jgi:hypothetical protein
VKDTGVWHRDGKGVVTLKSDKYFRDVERGPLRIFLRYHGPDDYLDKIQKDIKEFLKASQEKEFSIDQVKRIYQCQSTVSSDFSSDGIQIEYDFDLYEKKVKREELEALLNEIDIYKTSTDINEFKFIPLEFKHRVFLQWKNYDTPINRNPVRMIEELKSLKDDKTYPLYFFVDIDLNLFRKEANTTQPFRYIKEMNQYRKKGVLDHIMEKITRQCHEK